MSVRIPPNPLAVPAVLGTAYLLSYSTAAPFATVRAYLPNVVVRYTVPALFYIHILEAAFAAYRSAVAGRPLSDAVKWALVTFVWGFESLAVQKKQLGIK